MNKKNPYLTDEKQTDTAKKKRKPGMVKKVVLISLLVILIGALVYIGRLIYFGFVNPAAAFETAGAVASASESPSPSPVQSDEPSPAVTDSVEPSPTPEPSVDPVAEMLSKADLDFIKDKVSILLIGIDENPAREATGRKDFRTDVMMLLCINFKEKKVDIVSIPRDSYADIYGTNERWKLNGAFMKGGGFEGRGFEYTLKSVSMALGNIPINLYAAVQMYGLRDLIDALGGVDYNVDVSFKINGRTYKKGMQHLTGQQVLDYVRVRKGISTDIGRTERQQKLMLALFTQLQKQDKLTLIPKAFEALKDQIWTNLTIEQIIALVVFAKDMDPAQIRRHSLKGTYMQAYNAKYYVLDQSYLKKVIKDIYGISIKTNYKYDIAYVSVDMGAVTAVTNALGFLDKNGSKMTGAQIESLNALITKVKNQRKKLPSGISTLKTLTKQLNKLVYDIQKELTTPPETSTPPAEPTETTPPSTPPATESPSAATS